MLIKTIESIGFLPILLVLAALLVVFIAYQIKKEGKKIAKVMEKEIELLNNPEKFSASIAEEKNHESATKDISILHLTIVIPLGFDFDVLVKDIPGHHEWEMEGPFFAVDREETGVQILEKIFSVYRNSLLEFHITVSGKYNKSTKTLTLKDVTKQYSL